jgi:hypothetical protein
LYEVFPELGLVEGADTAVLDAWNLNSESQVHDFDARTFRKRLCVHPFGYECPLFVATFLSPRVAGLLCIDSTIWESQFKTRDPNHFFAGVIRLAESSRS